MKKLISFMALLPSLAVAERPNIIYIFTDQHTASALSCAGNSDVKTPNIDRLAAVGVRFQNAYCSAPLSGPSRAAMFTGYTPGEIGMMSNGTPMPDSVKSGSLGILLRDAGYECAYAGKWHLHTSDIPDTVFGFEKLHGHNDYGLAESVIAFLQRKHRKPFFLVASFDNPHNICEYARGQNLPFTDLKEPLLAQCPALPVNFARQPFDAEVIAYEQQQRYRIYPTVNYTSEDWRRYRNAYYRMVETVDAQIGQIVDAIDGQKLWKNTVVIFTGDHGDGVGAHKWNQKSALYEEVVNIPLIVTLPGQKNAGTTLSQLVNNGVDFYATVCQLAKITLPSDRYGKSFVSLATDTAQCAQNYIVTETLFDQGETHGWMVRTAHYKYVLYDKGRYREQLFDMEKDRGEMCNLTIEEKYREVLLQHRALLNEWMQLHKVSGVRKGLGHIPTH